MVICLNSCVVSLKYWIIQPHGPRVNHDQNAAVTLIISSKAWAGIVFVAWLIALSQPRTYSFVLCPGPRRADLWNTLDSWLAEDTDTGLGGQSKEYDLYWFHQVRLSCSALNLDAVSVCTCLWNMLYTEVGSPGFGKRLREQPRPSVCSAELLREKFQTPALPHLFTAASLARGWHFWSDSWNCLAQFYQNDLD